MLHTFRIYSHENELFISNSRDEISENAKMVDRIRAIKKGEVIPFNLPKTMPFQFCPSFIEYLESEKKPKPIIQYKDDVEKEIDSWLDTMVMYSPSEFLKKYFPFRMADMIIYSGYPDGCTLRRYYQSKPKLFILLALGVKQIKESKEG